MNLGGLHDILGKWRNLVELSAIEYLENKLGYNWSWKRINYCKWRRDSLADVVLVDRLRVH